MVVGFFGSSLLLFLYECNSDLLFGSKYLNFATFIKYLLVIIKL